MKIQSPPQSRILLVASGTAAESNTVDIAELPAGMYLLRRSFGDNKAETIKFTKR